MNQRSLLLSCLIAISIVLCGHATGENEGIPSSDKLKKELQKWDASKYDNEYDSNVVKAGVETSLKIRLVVEELSGATSNKQRQPLFAPTVMCPLREGVRYDIREISHGNSIWDPEEMMRVTDKDSGMDMETRQNMLIKLLNSNVEVHLIVKQGTDNDLGKYNLQFHVDANRAIITKCEQDMTFDSDKYLLKKKREEIESHLQKVFSAPVAERGALLPDKCLEDLWSQEVDQGRNTIEPIIVEKDTLPSRWKCAVLLREKHQYDLIEKKFDIVVEEQAMGLKIVECKLDEAFVKESTERDAIASFVRKYVEGTAEQRKNMTAEGLKMVLPTEGTLTVQGRLNYASVHSLDKEKGTWKCYCQIRHSGNFGKSGKEKAEWFLFTVQKGKGTGHLVINEELSR